MKALHKKRFLSNQSISDTAIPTQPQNKSRPFVTNSDFKGQELSHTPEKAKHKAFNFAEIPIFPGMNPAIPQVIQSKPAADILGAKAAPGESAQVTGAANSRVQCMPAQDNVVQRTRNGKQRADQPSGKKEDDSAYLADRAAIDAVLDEYYTDMLAEVSEEASPEELVEIADEDSLLTPIAEQILMLYQEQEETEFATNTQASSQNSSKQQEIPEDLLNEDPQEGSSKQTNSPDVQQEEDNTPLAEIFANIEQSVAEVESELPPESELENLAAVSESEQPQRPPSRRGVRRQPQPPIPSMPLTPQQEAQRLLPMDYTARQQAITDLQQQKRPAFVDLVIQELNELDRRQAAITGLEGRIPPQGTQQPQQPATRWEKVKERIDRPFENTKQPRKEVADGIKQHETYSDQTKILGQDSSHTNVDQVLGQNLPANDKDPNSYLNLPPGETEKFGNDAAVVGMTRDDVKAVGGLLLFSDSFKKFKSALRDKKKPKRERIANASDGLGNMTSAITYTGLVGTQARKGGEHHQNVPNSTHGSGALAAVKQGGTIAGTSIPFDSGKAVASILTTVPKLITYTDAGLKASQREHFGGHKSMGRGVKNVADLTKSAAGATKDVSSLVQAGGEVGAEAVKIIAGGAVAPAAASVFGTAEAIQGGYKFKKGYKNYKGLGGITGDTETLDQLKEIQKKKMKRAAINTVLGKTTLAAGIVGFTAGPPGLIAATAMGAGVGAFQIGQWGTRKLKQKLRDKGVKGFDPNKTTEKKNQARQELAGNTLTLVEGASNEEQETIFSSMGLNGNKKDNAVQQVYNDVLKKYLDKKLEEYTAKELQASASGGISDIPQAQEEIRTKFMNQDTIRILNLKGNKNNLQQEVSWEQLSKNKDFPADFVKLVKEAAINQALKNR
ncbi:MAG: hypothetical protein KME21_18165 [Desmonostoc vinosum HA7617-LM4]|jgi:hypothetical protein|nr:hypothetical protein [Desmonostoc vinosum HA7617-LM4]